MCMHKMPGLTQAMGPNTWPQHWLGLGLTHKYITNAKQNNTGSCRSYHGGRLCLLGRGVAFTDMFDLGTHVFFAGQWLNMPVNDIPATRGTTAHNDMTLARQPREETSLPHDRPPDNAQTNT